MTTTTPTRRRVLAPLSGLLLGMFVSMIASTVVSTSLPVIIHDLNGDQSAYTWVVTATLLTTAISTPVWGKLADLMGRKTLYQIALVIFVLATAAAGFAQDPGTLIAFRAAQGIGAGGLAALSQVLMADIISPRERGRYMGLFGAVMAVATVGGPLLGGVITDGFGWRWNFFVSLPIAVAALIMVQRTIPASAPSTRRAKIDYIGIVLLSTAVSLLLIWVTSAGRDYDWWSTETILMVGGAVLSAILFVIVELRTSEPLVPLTLFRDRTFTLSVVASIATGIAMFGASVFLGQYMQMARGATPTEAGLMTIPMIAGLLLSSVGVGALITRYGHWKPYLVVGSILLTAGAALLSTIHYDTDFFLVSVYMFLLGAGVGMTMQNLVLAVQNSAKPSEIGVASSGVTFFRSLGGTIGVSLMGAALASRVADLFTGAHDRLIETLTALGPSGAAWGEQLSSGTLPRVSEMPEQLRVIVEDIYAQGISSAFLIAVPFGILSILAVVFLPNRSLSTMTTSERRNASEADLATVSVPAGMDSITATGTVPVPDVDSDAEAEATTRR
ncbi:EmrB/QacA subfamily drug resistance transporter [Microbacterium sp. SORGH_AS 505]|uniref:MDR family MFS transporter n=1 Tax=Microbacterium sp. SORGH_AS_0505 TaxID=3041770 RepID=UPI0027812162|nr:MDR family MFS transporter [Microbacterium sp. SORGH_AS_0505]MDQ1126671.1 EmrB/QacA subfamily drug resistance transporter [Microbacterium sp. SORGH_AS_0505]